MSALAWRLLYTVIWSLLRWPSLLSFPSLFNGAVLLFLPQRCLQVLFSVDSTDMDLRWLL